MRWPWQRDPAPDLADLMQCDFEVQDAYRGTVNVRAWIWPLDQPRPERHNWELPYNVRDLADNPSHLPDVLHLVMQDYARDMLARDTLDAWLRQHGKGIMPPGAPATDPTRTTESAIGAARRGASG